MRAPITLKGLITWFMIVTIWFFFTIYGTNGEEVRVQTKLDFLGESSVRFEGSYLYYKINDGTKLKVDVDRFSYERLKRMNTGQRQNCDVIYFRNESLVFNEYQTVKSIQCDGRNLYSFSQ